MRRRNRPNADPTEDEELTQGLLSRNDDDDSHGHLPSTEAGPIIVYPGPFDLSNFIAYILQAWQVFWGNLFKYITVGTVQEEPLGLNAIQEARLRDLRSKLLISYDHQNPEHQDALLCLWSLAYSDKPFPGVKHPLWKEMGWQSDDPTTDFRGAGFYGLQNLLYFASNYPAEFQSLVLKSNGVRADWEYPFGAAGINVTYMLKELFELTEARMPTSVYGRCFLYFLDENAHAFEEVYCITFILLDRVWLDMKASYMQFNQVLQAVKKRLQDALNRKPVSIQYVRDTLLQ